MVVILPIGYSVLVAITLFLQDSVIITDLPVGYSVIIVVALTGYCVNTMCANNL